MGEIMGEITLEIRQASAEMEELFSNAYYCKSDFIHKIQELEMDWWMSNRPGLQADLAQGR